MKILFMAWSIYDSKIGEFSKTCTGGSLVIKNLCEYVGRKEEVYLFVGNRKLPQMELGHIHLVGTDKYQDIEDKSLSPDELRLRIMTYAFEMTLKDLKPDIVSFQGLGELARRCILICIQKNVPYIYTEHLYIEKDQNIEKYERDKEWANNIYSIPQINIITVSKGMKEKILNDFPQLKGRITAIANGTDFKPVRVNSDLKVKYQLQGIKVLICVGALTELKNQCQIVRAFLLLPSEVQKQIKILFCGKDRCEGKLQYAIAKANLEEQLIYTGQHGNEEMKKYLSVADGFITASRSEGFSIAALEAIAYGMPIVMFGDISYAEDIKEEKVVQIAEERSDECLADAIVKWYKKEWDKEYILNYAKYFTMERMAAEHISCYREFLSRKNNEEIS